MSACLILFLFYHFHPNLALYLRKLQIINTFLKQSFKKLNSSTRRKKRYDYFYSIKMKYREQVFSIKKMSNFEKELTSREFEALAYVVQDSDEFLSYLIDCL